jgi:hypothetical protein
VSRSTSLAALAQPTSGTSWRLARPFAFDRGDVGNRRRRLALGRGRFAPERDEPAPGSLVGPEHMAAEGELAAIYGESCLITEDKGDLGCGRVTATCRNCRPLALWAPPDNVCCERLTRW